MKENITIEITFNEEIERENQNFYFKYVWSKTFKEWKKIIVITFVFLFLGFYPIKNFDTNLLFYLFRYGGIFLFGLLLTVIYQYFISKKKFKKQVEDLISEFKTIDKPSYVSMNEEKIEFKNPVNTFSSIWEKVSFVKIDNFILINVINNLHFIINKSEFTNDEFGTILDYLEKYAKHQK
ncbi:hypothetical protein [Chryseobacterium lineare]